MNKDKDGNRYWTSHLGEPEQYGEYWVELKDLVSIEIAKKLKELGFNRESKGAILYEDGSWLIENASDNLDWNHMWGPMYHSDVNCMTIPTWDITLQWLKEVHNMQVEVRYQEYLREFYYLITHDSKTYGFIDCEDPELSTHDAALEYGIKKCLKILEEKKNE